MRKLKANATTPYHQAWNPQWKNVERNASVYASVVLGSALGGEAKSAIGSCTVEH